MANRLAAAAIVAAASRRTGRPDILRSLLSGSGEEAFNLRLAPRICFRRCPAVAIEFTGAPCAEQGSPAADRTADIRLPAAGNWIRPTSCDDNSCRRADGAAA